MDGPLAPPAALTVLYTAGLRGDLDRLPRLFTFLRELRAREEGSAVLLLDLGESCAPEVWHCAVTSGRSMLIALDGMGYHAAYVPDFPPDLRAKMGDLTQMALVDAAHPYAFSAAVQVAAGPTDTAAPLVIQIAPARETAFDGRTLHLAAVEREQVGCVQLRGGRLDSVGVFDLPARAEPDPTIAGVVDFILSEARYTQKRGR